MASSFDPRVRQLIVQEALRNGVDPEAALAVAMGEGGIRFGAVGDGGTSFGPFQLHMGGALPKKYWGNAAAAKAFANSPAGVAYAMRQIGAVARGLKGEAAVNAIVRRFERPADPDTSVSRAVARLGSLGSVPQGEPAPLSPNGGGAAMSPSGGTDLRRQLALSLIGRASATAAGQRPSMVGSLLQLAAMRDQLGAAQEVFGEQAEGSLVPRASGGPVKGFRPGSPIIGGSHGGEHGTSGLAGYSGVDYFAKPGSPAVAPVSGKVVKLSGHDPRKGAVQGPGGPLGWSVYIQGDDGRTYYLTHMGSRSVKVGQRVKAGQRIGTVANYDKFGRPSHIHMGIK